MVVLPSWAPCWSVEVCASAPGRARDAALERQDSAGEQIAQWKAHWRGRRCEIDGPSILGSRTVCSKYLRVNAFSDSVLLRVGISDTHVYRKRAVVPLVRLPAYGNGMHVAYLLYASTVGEWRTAAPWSCWR